MQQVLSELPIVHGLSDEQITSLQKEYGRNELVRSNQFRLFRILFGLVKEPMFLLLATACLLYFILGENAEGFMMIAAIAVVFTISAYQEVRSSRAIRSLRELTSPLVKVTRNGLQVTINSKELVPGDVMLLEEGQKIPADGIILQSNDLTLNEAVLTGESIPVSRNSISGNNRIFQGTLIDSGRCMAMVTATGNHTQLGKIGVSVEGFSGNKTILQVQVNKMVNSLAMFGLIAFLLIFAVNFYYYRAFSTSLLFALTLAMSVIPEEIPVAFSSFMALGAYKMSRLGIISRQPQIIENLGAVNVLCLDKTGTITENKMVVDTIYNFRTDKLNSGNGSFPPDYDRLLLYAVLSSEYNPFDAMEKAIMQAYLHVHDPSVYRQMQMVHEYPLEGTPPMMTHVYHYEGKTVVASKGAPERIMNVCRLSSEAKAEVQKYITALGQAGFRLLGVASAVSDPAYPERQDDFQWEFEGILALYDPPKKGVEQIIRNIYDSRVEIKLLTGDYSDTAITIAKRVGIKSPSVFHTGEQVMNMTEDELRAAVRNTHIFARMFPEAKLKVVRAIQANGNVVAMTGDGVNDAPALKAADIGIAMGKKGSETAQQAADLVLTDDNLEKINLAIAEGRRIYQNLIKAIRYIISIHIPIILTASLPLILGWKFPNIFSPIHIIFLELIMGPTCSIFFEREPVEGSIIKTGPRQKNQRLFVKGDLMISILQGLIITAGVLFLYYYFMRTGSTLQETRTIVFTTLIAANIFLTFSSRSYTRSIKETIHYPNKLTLPLLFISGAFLSIILLYPPAQSLFGLSPVSIANFSLCMAIAFITVAWFEIYKSGLPQPGDIQFTHRRIARL